MSRAEICALLVLVALSAYAVLGGADYGGGILDLFARGPRARRQRVAIARSMGPVWEANHIWLVFVLVALFTAFPPAFQALAIVMFLPLLLALVGIVLRGVAFAFRGYLEGEEVPYNTFSRLFGVASVVTPILFGATAGGLALLDRDDVSYRDGVVRTGDALVGWTEPFGWVCGGLALLACAYLAATFMTVDARRLGADDLAEDFRGRALVAGAAAGAFSIVGLLVAEADAPRLYDRLTGEALPLVLLGVACGAVSIAAIWLRRFALARVAVAGAVTSVVVGWGVAQYPYLVGPDLTVEGAAATPPMLLAFIIVALAGLTLMAPCLWLLFVYFRRQPMRLPSS